MTTNNDLPASGFVTLPWVRRRYAISNSTLYNWVREQKLPQPYRIGPRAVRFRVEDLRKFEESLQTAGTEAE